MPHDVRDHIVDFVRRWSEASEIGAGRFVGWLGVACGLQAVCSRRPARLHQAGLTGGVCARPREAFCGFTDPPTSHPDILISVRVLGASMMSRPVRNGGIMFSIPTDRLRVEFGCSQGTKLRTHQVRRLNLASSKIPPPDLREARPGTSVAQGIL